MFNNNFKVYLNDVIFFSVRLNLLAVLNIYFSMVFSSIFRWNDQRFFYIKNVLTAFKMYLNKVCFDTNKTEQHKQQ